jgi:hypothetical protein
MKMRRLNMDNVYAKILALSIIYAKEESRRRVFLERISYSPEEMTAVMDVMDKERDFDFRH